VNTFSVAWDCTPLINHTGLFWLYIVP
jgi:hypothetical protein